MYKRVFLFLMVSMLTFCFAKEQNFSQNEVGFIEAIIQNKESCVQEINEDRIYLLEDKIYPSEDGLFLLLNEDQEFLRLMTLYSDYQGSFVKCNPSYQSTISEPWIKVFNDCPYCGYEYVIRCRRPECPNNKKKK